MNIMKAVIVSVLCTWFLCAPSPSTAGGRVDYYEDMDSGQKMYYGRIVYVRGEHIEAVKRKRKLGFFEDSFADKWNINGIALCFSDGTAEGRHIKPGCRAVQTKEATITRGLNPKQIFSFASSAKKLSLTTIMLSGSKYMYVLKLLKPRVISAANAKERAIYLGDIIVGIHHTRKSRDGRVDIPVVMLDVLSRAHTTKDDFIRAAEVSSESLKFHANPLNFKKAEYRIMIADKKKTEAAARRRDAAERAGKSPASRARPPAKDWNE